jgi:hypothetical protein
MKKKALFIKLATEENGKRLEARTLDISHNRSALELLEARDLEDKKRVGCLNILSEHRFAEEEMIEIERAARENPIPHAELHNICQDAMSSPVPIALAKKQELEAYIVEAQSNRPFWLSFVAHQRDVFKGTVLTNVADGDGVYGYFFLYATQQPVVTSFLKVYRSMNRTVEAQTVPLDPPGGVTLPEEWEHRGEICDGRTIDFNADGDGVFVLFSMCFVGSFSVAGSGGVCLFKSMEEWCLAFLISCSRMSDDGRHVGLRYMSPIEYHIRSSHQFGFAHYMI